MAKKKIKLTYLQKLHKLKVAGISESPPVNRLPNDLDDLPELNVRVHRLLNIVNTPNRPVENMLFFIMYDIESNKVRHHISKYLIRKGCMRIQRSIFLADLHVSVFEEIKSTLAEIQSLYENQDSIIVVPISTDYLKAMKVIGKSLDVDLIINPKNTLFF